MKKLLAVCSLFIALGVQAQHKQMMNKEGRQMTEEMFMQNFQDLNLTKDQEAKLKAFYQENEGNRAEMQAQRAERNKEIAQLKEQRMEMREAHEAKIKEILTPAQFEKFQENRKAKMSERMGERMNAKKDCKGDCPGMNSQKANQQQPKKVNKMRKAKSIK